MANDKKNLPDYKGNPDADTREVVIPREQGGLRLDQALSKFAIHRNLACAYPILDPVARKLGQ